MQTTDHIPTTDELLPVLRRMTEERKDNPPSMWYYTRGRPQGWCSAPPMLRQMGYSPDEDGWELLMVDLLGRGVSRLQLNAEKPMPTDQQVRDLIMELSRDGVAPPQTIWNEHRNPEWPSIATYVAKTGKLYTDICKELGLRMSTGGSFMSPELDEQPDALPDSEAAQSRRSTAGGFNCIPKTYQVRTWHPFAKAWVPVEGRYETWLQVR